MLIKDIIINNIISLNYVSMSLKKVLFQKIWNHLNVYQYTVLKIMEYIYEYYVAVKKNEGLHVWIEDFL